MIKIIKIIIMIIVMMKIIERPALYLVFLSTTQIIMAVSGTVALACAFLPWMILPVVLLWVMMEAVRRFTVHTAREMKRNECIGMCN